MILTLKAGKRLIKIDLKAANGYWDKALYTARAAMQSVRELVVGKESDKQFELVSFLVDMANVPY